jgi:hypothetical protein
MTPETGVKVEKYLENPPLWQGRIKVHVNELYLLMSGVERVGIARKSYVPEQTKTPHW